MKATEKASERALVPRRLALAISRRRPKMRDPRVRRDSVEPWRRREREDEAMGPA
jgi:hypothetical protein